MEFLKNLWNLVLAGVSGVKQTLTFVTSIIIIRVLLFPLDRVFLKMSFLSIVFYNVISFTVEFVLAIYLTNYLLNVLLKKNGEN